MIPTVIERCAGIDVGKMFLTWASLRENWKVKSGWSWRSSAMAEAELPCGNVRHSASIREVLLQLCIPTEKQDQTMANRVARILKFEGWQRHYEGKRDAREKRSRR
jgi:hypothetical protein